LGLWLGLVLVYLVDTVTCGVTLKHDRTDGTGQTGQAVNRADGTGQTGQAVNHADAA